MLLHKIRLNEPQRMYSNRELIKGCKANKPKYQKALYDTYVGKVMGVCRRYTNNYEDAEDVLQEAFVKIFKYIGNVKEDNALPAWIKRTTINTAITIYRRNKKHQDQINYEHVGELNINTEQIISQLSNQELVALINQLPDGYRVVFNLYVIEGFNHREIANMLEISEGTSKSQLSRAKALLKNFLKKTETISYE